MNFLQLFWNNEDNITLEPIPAAKRYDVLCESNKPFHFPKNETTTLTFPVETNHPPAFVDANNEAIKFDINKPQHLQYLKDCNQQFKETFARLKSLDTRINLLCVSYFLTTIPQMIVANRPFSGHIMRSILAQKATNEAICSLDEGIAISAFYMQGQRSGVYKEYREIFLQQIHNMAWATGYWGSDDDREMLTNIQNHPVINDLVTTMSEVLTIAEIKAIISDEIEALFLQNAETLHKALYSGRRQAVNLCLYGTNSDSIISYVKAPALYVIDTASNAKDFVQSFAR